MKRGFRVRWEMGPVWLLVLGVLSGVLLEGHSAEAQFILEKTLPNAVEVPPELRLGKVHIEARVLPAEPVTREELRWLREDFKNSCSADPGFYLEQEQNPMSIADLALKVWGIVQDNKAVLNVDKFNSKALPYLANNRWEILTGWKPQNVLEYSFYVENLYGIKVVEMKYDVRLIYGGGVKGVGKYIASARVVPKHVDVLWGFGLDVSVKEAAIQNLGSEKRPFAAITLDVGMTWGSILQRTSEIITYRLDADGAIHDQTNGRSYFVRK
jgi:hypothetical protein